MICNSIQKKQLESLNKSFGNNHPIFPRPEIQRYFSIVELEKRCSSIDELCTYFIDSYEEYISNQEYLNVL